MSIAEARKTLGRLDRTIAAQGPAQLWVQSAAAIRFLLTQTEGLIPAQRSDEDDIEYLDRMRQESPDLSLDDLGFVRTATSDEQGC